jgi:hypothetical protein
VIVIDTSDVSDNDNHADDCESTPVLVSSPVTADLATNHSSPENRATDATVLPPDNSCNADQSPSPHPDGPPRKRCRDGKSKAQLWLRKRRLERETVLRLDQDNDRNLNDRSRVLFRKHRRDRKPSPRLDKTSVRDAFNAMNCGPKHLPVIKRVLGSPCPCDTSKVPPTDTPPPVISAPQSQESLCICDTPKVPPTDTPPPVISAPQSQENNSTNNTELRIDSVAASTAASTAPEPNERPEESPHLRLERVDDPVIMPPNGANSLAENNHASPSAVPAETDPNVNAERDERKRAAAGEADAAPPKSRPRLE